MDFREAWERVSQLEGQTFSNGRGQEFTYRFKKTYVVVNPGGQSVPRTNFEKVFRRLDDPNAANAPAVQGQRWISAIYADSRFPKADTEV